MNERIDPVEKVKANTASKEMSANKRVACSHRGGVRPGVRLPERARRRYEAWCVRGAGVGLTPGSACSALRREKDVFSENKGEGTHEEMYEEMMIEWEGLDRPAEDKRHGERKRAGQRRSAVLFAALAG